MSNAFTASFPQLNALSVGTVRLGLISRIFSGGTPDRSNMAFWQVGDLPWVASGEVNQFTVCKPSEFITRDAVHASATKLMPANSIIIALAGQGKTKAMAAQMAIDAYGNQSLACIDRFKGYNRFLLWWLTSLYREIRGLSSQETRDGLNQSIIGQLPVPLFYLNTQKAIADFLDREIARIDQLIEEKQRMVRIIEEKEQAVISAASCKGLDRNVRFVPTGVEWLGNVPVHWIVCRFNRLICEKVDYRGRTPEKVDEGIFLVTARNVRRGKLDYERAQEFTTEAEWLRLRGRGAPEIGDVIFTTEAPLGEVANVDRTDVAFAQRIMKLRGVPGKVDNYYLKYFMMSDAFQWSLSLFASGSTASGIKSERMAHLFGLRPPVEEQKNIVRFIEAEVARIDRIRAPLSRSIDRLRELRSALITAAVTGQVNVATWGKRGTTDRRLDVIESNMAAAAHPERQQARA